MKPRLLICAFMLFCSVYSISQGNYTDINPDIVEYTAQINYYFDIDKDGTDDFYIRYHY